MYHINEVSFRIPAGIPKRGRNISNNVSLPVQNQLNSPLPRDTSLASLDKLQVPGPGKYETNISSCVSTEATRKMKNEYMLRKASER